MKTLLLLIGLLIVAGCTTTTIKQDTGSQPNDLMPEQSMSEDETMTDSEPNLEVATFAGGCFWCTESTFEHYEGVDSVISGYTGGTEADPTYEEVSAKKTSHLESVEVYYDPDKITYNDLLEIFWRLIDPTDGGGSFVDRGPQYRSAIFYHNDEQKRLAEESRQRLGDSGMYDKPIVTEIRPAMEFFPAEEYHQDYYKKHEVKYKFYRFNSGRDQYIESVWGDDKDYVVPEHDDEVMMMMDENTEKPWMTFTKPSDEEIKQELSAIQYKVTQKDGTEKPFANEYWDNKEEGIYVDILSGEPLFSSKDIYKSGTGWPSFTQPLEPGNIVEREDNTLFSKRTEIRSRYGDNHLGHVFNDGPEPTGLRYCMNSAALRFISKGDLEKEGYGEYLDLFA